MTDGTRFPYQSFVWDSRRWDGVVLRDDDIVISTAPKCGTTWMQMQVALLLFRTPDLPAPLASLSPWLDMNTRPLDEVLATLDAQTHRRFIKTHLPLPALPWDDQVTYLHVARDPRDAALSWDNHLANVDMERLFELRSSAVGIDDLDELARSGALTAPAETEAGRFWQYVEGADPATMSMLEQLVFHTATFWAVRDRPNVHLFHYAEMRANPAGEMARLAEALGVEPPTDELVAAADFRAMKERADVLVPNSDTPFWNSADRFFDQARSAAWHSVIDDEASAARYEQVLRATGVDEAPIRWLHQGPV